jgi:hypothetical protein
MNALARRLMPLADAVLAPLVYPCAWLLKAVRRAGVHRMPLCRAVLMQVGVFPIRDHYFEPQFDLRKAAPSLSRERPLPGIDWNAEEQLRVLDALRYSGELGDLPQSRPAGLEFYMSNGSFVSGDAEYWYQLIRLKKPRRIFEIGSGNSTLMAVRALRRNRAEDSGYGCKHVCIEPYPMPWLRELPVTLIREKVEDIDAGFFSELEDNDVLFIDSSHVIRPQGDVLYEYLELLPRLGKGVIVHVHDVFSPRNYPAQWLVDEVRLWNEQYLLEAFLSHNGSWKVIGALNYLHHHHYERLKAVAPFLAPDREPGSFYIQRVA